MYIKTTFVGIVALFATTVVYLVGTIVVLIHNYQPPPGGMVRITLPELLNRPKYWLIVLEWINQESKTIQQKKLRVSVMPQKAKD